MAEDWAFRIRSWRTRSGLTQEALADLFRVDARTVRRWESGATRPPQTVRERLQRTNVPLIRRPEVAALAQVVSTSPLGTMLMDENLTVIAISERERQFWLRHHGVDLAGRSWEPYIPPFFLPLFDAYGGWRATIKAGAASLTGDFRIPTPGAEATGLFTGRIQYTILRMADGTMVHNFVGATLAPDAELHPPRLTFIDEIHQIE